MEAHDARLLGEQHREHRIVLEEAAIDLLQLRGRRSAEALEGAAQIREPRGLDVPIRLGGLMAKYIHVERALGVLSYRVDHTTRTLRVRGADSDRAERTGIGDGRGHGG